MQEDDPKEVTTGGSTVYRHEPRAEGFSLAHGDEERMAAIEAHVTGFVGPVDWVFHEIVSDLVHIDVHVVAPTPDRPAWTLFTSGMSDLPMSSPEGAPQRLELMLALPPDWKLSQEDFKDERWYWPVRLLKMLARLPHQYQTWLFMDHTIPNGDPAVEYAPGARFDGAIVLPAMSLPPDFSSFEACGEKHYVMAVYPLYGDEMRLKLDHGAELLMDLLEKAGVTEILEPGRPSVAATYTPPKKKRFFGLF
jgi:hypothetical protein